MCFVHRDEKLHNRLGDMLFETIIPINGDWFSENTDKWGLRYVEGNSIFAAKKIY